MTSDQGLPSELALMDGLAQADLVRRREITPRELVQAAIDRIEQGNPVINAVVHRRFEQALEEAGATSSTSNAPFAGVPFLLKDVGATQLGVPQTAGNLALKRMDRVAEADTVLGRRFRESGLITLGVTNAPDLAMLGDTQPLAFGPTRNPWSLDRSASGSSGGSAAAVAAGFVPIAHGNDGGGSLRQPAAWCGVFSLMPSRGRMPRPVGEFDDLVVEEFVITRTVRDAAAVLDAVNGALPGDLYGLRRPDMSYLETLTSPGRPLRVGLVTEGPTGMPVSAECVRAVEEAASLLQDAGHHIEATYPPALLEQAPDSVTRIHDRDRFGECSEWLAQVLGRPVREEDVDPYTWWRFQDIEPVSAAELRAALRWGIERSARLLQWWEEGFDLLVTPVVNEPPDLLADLAAQSPKQLAQTSSHRYAAFLEPFNASGQPAAAFPIRWTEDDIPVGVQIAAARGEERLLLQVALQLEEAVGWPSRMPKGIACPST